MPPLLMDSGLERRLRIRHLSVLLAVAETKSMYAAARRVNLTQSAVSKCVREAEDILGVQMFERTKRGVNVSEIGESVLGRVRVLLTDLVAARDDIVAIKAGAVGRVRVGTMAVVEADLLPRTIVRVRQVAPRLSIQIVEGARELIVGALRRGEIDCAVGRLSVSDVPADLQQEALYRIPVAIVVGRHHPLARQRRVTWSQLCDFEWIMPVRGAPVRQALDSQFMSLRLCAPTVAVESTAFLVNQSLLTSSDMVTVMTLRVARTYEAMGVLKVLPIDLHVELPHIGVITRTPVVPSATKMFLAALRQEAAEMDVEGAPKEATGDGRRPIMNELTERVRTGKEAVARVDGRRV